MSLSCQVFSENSLGPNMVHTSNATIIDSHGHLDLIARHHPHRIQWLMEKGGGFLWLSGSQYRC
jgi:hypothetical protein